MRENREVEMLPVLDATLGGRNCSGSTNSSNTAFLRLEISAAGSRTS